MAVGVIYSLEKDRDRSEFHVKDSNLSFYTLITDIWMLQFLTGLDPS